MDWAGWALFGLVATAAIAAIAAIMIAAQLTGLTRLDLPLLLGTIVTENPGGGHLTLTEAMIAGARRVRPFKT